MSKKEVNVAVLAAQESKLHEFTADLQGDSVRKNCFWIARQIDRGEEMSSVCAVGKMMLGMLCLMLMV